MAGFPRCAREPGRWAANDLNERRIMDRGQVSDTWERGDSYEQFIGRWSRRVAPQFLSWLNLPAGLRWLALGYGGRTRPGRRAAGRGDPFSIVPPRSAHRSLRQRRTKRD